MRTILAHLEISPGLDSILETAFLVARQFDSYIEGFHMRPGQPDVIAAGADGFVAAAPDLVAGFPKRPAKRTWSIASEDSCERDHSTAIDVSVFQVRQRRKIFGDELELPGFRFRLPQDFVSDFDRSPLANPLLRKANVQVRIDLEHIQFPCRADISTERRV